MQGKNITVTSDHLKQYFGAINGLITTDNYEQAARISEDFCNLLRSIYQNHPQSLDIEYLLVNITAQLGHIYFRLKNYQQSQYQLNKIKDHPQLQDKALVNTWHTNNLFFLNDDDWVSGFKALDLANPGSPADPIDFNQDQTGKKVLIYQRGGFGDVLQFMRYLPIFNEKGMSITVSSKDALAPLFQKFDFPVEFKSASSNSDNLQSISYDYQASFMALPYLFNTNKKAVPFSDFLFPKEKFQSA